MQTESYNISILPGDGIGEEIAKEARKLIDWISPISSIATKSGGLSIGILSEVLR